MTMSKINLKKVKTKQSKKILKKLKKLDESNAIKRIYNDFHRIP